MTDFYASFHLNKKHLGLTNKKIAEKVDMTADALRMAIQNKSLKPKQIKRIEKYFNWHKSRLNTDEKP